MTVEELLAARKWRPIPNCPGRYVLVKSEPTLAPQQLAQVNCAPAEFHVKAANDVVTVLALEGGGLITYRRPDGSYCHTLNTESGFKRKLGVCPSNSLWYGFSPFWDGHNFQKAWLMNKFFLRFGIVDF
jgi:hypothetical protein